MNEYPLMVKSKQLLNSLISVSVTLKMMKIIVLKRDKLGDLLLTNPIR